MKPLSTCCLVVALLVPSAALGAFTTGKYRGKSSRNGALTLEVGKSKVTRFSIRLVYRCSHGDRWSDTEKGIPAMRIRSGKFSGRFKLYRGAGRFRITGKLADNVASGKFTASFRFNASGRSDRRGSVRCRTGTLTFRAKGKRASPAPAPPVEAPAGPSYDELSCSRLAGSGRFSNPLVIGAVTRNTLVRGCAPLTSGAGFNTRYFSFRLVSPAPANSLLAALFRTTPSAASAVHPRLATTGGSTLMTSRSHGFWLGDPSSPYGRALPAAGLVGPYVLGVEKLSSPLGSLTTPAFNLAIALP